MNLERAEIASANTNGLNGEDSASSDVTQYPPKKPYDPDEDPDLVTSEDEELDEQIPDVTELEQDELDQDDEDIP
jgi:hypothetical protein